MSERFLVRIEVWPHSTGRGSDVDQIQAGSRERVFEVAASDVRDALQRAELLALGICSNPIVWQAPIKEIRQLRHDEHVPSSHDQHLRDLEAAGRLLAPREGRHV